MIEYICDRCGKESRNDKMYIFKIRFAAGDTQKTTHLCISCKRIWDVFIKGDDLGITSELEETPTVKEEVAVDEVKESVPTIKEHGQIKDMNNANNEVPYYHLFVEKHPRMLSDNKDLYKKLLSFHLAGECLSAAAKELDVPYQKAFNIKQKYEVFVATKNRLH